MLTWSSLFEGTWQNKRYLRFKLAFVNIRTSLKNKRWRIFINLETFIPVILRSTWIFFNRRLRPSMASMKRIRDSGKPYRKPMPLWKNVEGSPFMSSAMFALVTQLIIQFRMFWRKPNLIKIILRKSQFMQSKAFLRSSLSMRKWVFFFFILCKHSCAEPTTSRICRPFKNRSYSVNIVHERIGLILFAVILEMSL